MEALNALRESVVSGGIATVDKDNSDAFPLGGVNLPASYKLPYKSQMGKADFYSLGTAVVLAKYLSKIGGTAKFRYAEYLREAKKVSKDPAVAIADWKGLGQYLCGESDECPHVFPDQLPEQVVPGLGGSGNKVADAAVAAIKRKRDQRDQRDQRYQRDADAVPDAGAGADVHMGDDTMVDADDTLHAIEANEIRLRNRNTMLSVPGRSFDAVMDILYKVGVEEMNRTKKLNMANVNPNSVTAPRSSGRYQRQTTADAAMRQMGADALGIENVGFGGGDPGDADEINFSQPREGAAAPSQAPVPPRQKQQLVVPKPSSRSDASRAALPKMTPLILVPPSTSTLLNLYNIKQFLEDGVFVPPEEAREANPNKEAYVRCLRTEGKDPKRPVKYHVTDRDPSRKEDWERLVSVCALGKAWQFKRWPYKGAGSGDMVDTFLKVAGVYFHYADEPIDPLIKQWNVKLIPISRHNRANDGSAQRAFWEYLDAFVSSRPGLSSRVAT